jgi:hypothetical protein
VYTPLAADEVYIANSSVGLNVGEATTAPAGENDVRGLLHGGQHLEDVNRNFRRQEHRRAVRLFQSRTTAGTTTELPRQTLITSVVNQGLKRPRPRSW